MTKNEQAAPSEQMRRRARRMRRVNVPMRVVLNLPFRTFLSRQLMLLFYNGRKTGRAYRQPVSYVADGDTLLTPGGGRWKLNLREGEAITVRLGGTKVQLKPEFVRDPDEVERLLRLMMTKNRRLASFVPFIGADGHIDRQSLDTALSHGFCIVRWHREATRP